MKKLINFLSLGLCCIIMTASSCSHKTDSTVTPTGTTTGTTGTTGTSTISTTAPAGGWRLSLFSEPGEKKTSHFSGYTFTFASDGTMTAVRGSVTVSGTWRQYSDDGITKFGVNLSTTDNYLLELNDDWAIVSKSDNFISLKDDNATKNEQLQFSK